MRRVDDHAAVARALRVPLPPDHQPNMDNPTESHRNPPGGGGATMWGQSPPPVDVRSETEVSNGWV